MAENVVPFRRPMTPERALELIRAATKDTGNLLGWTDHAQVQVDERGLAARQVLTVLEEADLRRGPEWDEEHKDWVCTLRKFVSGRTVTVVVGIEDTRGGVSIITAY